MIHHDVYCALYTYLLCAYRYQCYYLTKIGLSIDYVEHICDEEQVKKTTRIQDIPSTQYYIKESRI